jgi:hypothetical protein
MRGIFRLAEELLAFNEGLYPMEFVSWPSLIAFSPVSDTHTIITLCNKVRTGNEFLVAVRAVSFNYTCQLCDRNTPLRWVRNYDVTAYRNTVS